MEQQQAAAMVVDLLGESCQGRFLTFLLTYSAEAVERRQRQAQAQMAGQQVGQSQHGGASSVANSQVSMVGCWGLGVGSGGGREG